MVNTEIRLIIFFIAENEEESFTQSSKTRSGADCGSDHQLLIAKFRLLNFEEKNFPTFEESRENQLTIQV